MARPAGQHAPHRGRGPHGRRRRLGCDAPRPRRARLHRRPRRGGRGSGGREPGERARCRRDGARPAQRVRDPCPRPRRAPRSRDRQPRDGDRRDRDPGGGARDPLPLDAAPVPARRGGRRRDDPHPLPLARPAPLEDAAEHPHAREARLDHPQRDGIRGLRRHRDADHGQADSRGRTRLPRADAPAARALLRAAAEPADLQAAARDLRIRAVLPDRPLLPGRGSPRRSPPGADPARRRDGLPRPGLPLRDDRADRRPDLARVPRSRDPDPVPADDVGGGGPALRIGQAGPALRARDRGGDRRHARVGVQGVRRRRLRPLPADPARALARRSREARGGCKALGRKGARLRRLRRRRRGALADREVPLRGRARSGSGPSPGIRSCSGRTSRRWCRACSARSGCTSAASTS